MRIVDYLLIFLFLVSFLIRKHIMIKLPYFYGILAAMCLLQIVFSKLNPFMLPIYGVILLNLAFSFVAVTSPKLKIISIIFIILSILITIAPISFLYIKGMQNASYMSYSDSFQLLKDTLVKNYPYTNWKNINLEGIYKKYENKISLADKNKDEGDYFKIVKEFLNEIPDGHISIYPIFKDDFKNKRTEAIGATFGFSIFELDDGRVISTVVDENSEAYKNGIRFGTEILKWNGVGIKTAVKNTNLTWELHSSATWEYEKSNKYFYFTRTEKKNIGKEATIVFKDNKVLKEINVKAYSDNNQNIKTAINMFYSIKDAKAEVESKILNNNIGVIKISTFTPNNKSEFIKKYDNAMKDFSSKNIDKLIIDLRANNGGEDAIVADFLGYFFDNEDFYYSEAKLSSNNKSLVKQSKDFIIKPKTPYFKGQVVILINNKTISAPEGLCYKLKTLPNIKTLGFQRTNGSFGTIDALKDVLMPHNLIVIYPHLASVDSKLNIICDTDANGIGGVSPDIKLPINEENLRKIYIDNIDLELEKALELFSTTP